MATTGDGVLTAVIVAASVLMMSSGRAINARAEACVPLIVAAHAPRPAANAWRRESNTI
jgi:hypothetical protein